MHGDVCVSIIVQVLRIKKGHEGLVLFSITPGSDSFRVDHL